MNLTPIQRFVFENWTLTCSAISFAFVGLLGWNRWLRKQVLSTNTHKENAALQATIAALKEENSEIKEYSKNRIHQLETKNSELEKEISEKCSKDALLAKYPFDSKLGICIHRDTKEAVCPKCFHADPSLPKPLQDEGDNWRCISCGHVFSKNPEQARERARARNEENIRSRQPRSIAGF